MVAAGVPTAAYSVVDRRRRRAWPRSRRYPAVIKADGLAAGKGVVIAADEAEARAALEDLLVEHRFGTDARRGRGAPRRATSCSLLALCDGERALPLASAQDYKRIFDGDRARTPAAWAPTRRSPAIDEPRADEICAAVHQPVLDVLRPARARRSTASSTPG